MKVVTPPFRAKTRMAAGPAVSTASPVSTKMPAPIIAPMPTIVASSSVSVAAGDRSPEWLTGDPLRSLWGQRRLSCVHTDRRFSEGRYKISTGQRGQDCGSAGLDRATGPRHRRRP